MEGWLKLFYRFKEWEWYGDTNMVRLFIHLLLSANYKPLCWQGKSIPRGALITSRAKLSQETTLSPREIRTCLTRLKSTNEIAIETTNQYTIVTINNYERYQDIILDGDQQDDQRFDRQPTNERPTKDQRATTSKEYKNIRREEVKNNIAPSLRSGASSDLQSNPEAVRLDEEKFVEFFNSEMEAQGAIIPKIKSLGKNRRTHIDARCREHGKKALMEMVRKAARSNFLNGRNKRGWKATFDWLILPTNFIKVIEGTYDNDTEQLKNTQQSNDTKPQDRYAKRRGADSTARSADDYTDTL